ncbi:hypothetical protein G7046_g2144 [Stylonectria norvegica]|nr:hypothetical protein G7046_g2144 [Stylonectria norvegica]
MSNPPDGTSSAFLDEEELTVIPVKTTADDDASIITTSFVEQQQDNSLEASTLLQQASYSGTALGPPSQISTSGTATFPTLSSISEFPSISSSTSPSTSTSSPAPLTVFWTSTTTWTSTFVETSTCTCTSTSTTPVDSNLSSSSTSPNTTPAFEITLPQPTAPISENAPIAETTPLTISNPTSSPPKDATRTTTQTALLEITQDPLVETAQGSFPSTDVDAPAPIAVPVSASFEPFTSFSVASPTATAHLGQTTALSASIPTPTSVVSSLRTVDDISSVVDSQETFPATTSLSNNASTIRAEASAVSDQARASGTSSDSGINVVGQGSRNPPSTPVLVGSVVGGLAMVSMIAFCIWLWRRRVRKNRRSTLLTPLSISPSQNFGEAYEIDQRSLGPTPLPTKWAAVITYNARRIGRRCQQPLDTTGSSVNLNRGNSQFMEPTPTHSRDNSLNPDHTTRISNKGPFLGWWSRQKANPSFERVLRNKSTEAGRYVTRPMTESRNEAVSRSGALTFPDTEDKQRGNSNQPRRMRRSHRRSSASANRFLGDLGHDSEDAKSPTPFSDANATVGHPVLMQSKLLTNRNSSNSHPWTQKAPDTYITDVRRSRGNSMASSQVYQTPSMNKQSYLYHTYLESAQSGASFTTQRNKVRSDPFDLELGNASILNAQNRRPVPQDSLLERIHSISQPVSIHTRNESFTSRYTSGMSAVGTWGDPGPDVGIAASRRANDEDGRPSRYSTELSQGSNESASVGKAL